VKMCEASHSPCYLSVVSV